ncbi:MAG TPA: peptide deformylase [Acidimicrobiales bacterium]|nr:peptide deformylase [Acidimicrobiales bacterium]
MATIPIRIFGDPVLRQRASEVAEVDGKLARLAEDMIATMYDAPGVGLAAPQIGVQRRLFVYDVGDGPNIVINPEIVESSGEWSYHEGCLSIPDLAWDVVRPKQVHLVGIGIDGEVLDIEADELLARCFQHEVDHLDGVLLVERLEPDQRKEAKAILRRRALADVGLAGGAGELVER